MAGEWIKMRASLLTNPKVIRIARALLQDPEFLAWFNGEKRDSNCDVTCDEATSHAVTQRDAHLISVVTRVTVGALLPLWSSVNDCASNDAVLPSAGLFEIDTIAGVPGFGKALMTVGWIDLQPNDDGVLFENFSEHNTVGKERSTGAKTGAERTKEYRARVRREAAERDASHAVTVTSQRDHREEKSREEKKDLKPIASTEKISLDAAGKWQGIPENLATTWHEACPAVNVQAELAKAAAWIIANPKNKKSNYARFLTSWLTRAQDGAKRTGGGSVSGNGQPYDARYVN